MVQAGTTPFALGVYAGDPDNATAANEATFESNYASFVSTMDAVPVYFDEFVDQSQPVSQWVGNSQWSASSAAASADTRSMTPVIALPMDSTASGALSPDASFQAFASGSDDSTLDGIVGAWAAQGFKNLVFRPGWEMNLTDSNYAGADAQTQADWVAAFQHIYTALHAAAAADGINVQVAWNPSVTNYASVSATGTLYPGNNFVDLIAADMYSDMYPYSDGTSPPTYHDWDTGGEDTSVAQFIADPVNREHYWSEPAATRWASDSSGGHSQSLDSLIQFAEQQGKPFAIAETGAGNASAGTDVADDAAFPGWLAQQLTTAEQSGLAVQFVNLWDSNAGGSYEFSQAADGKPAEAAAWATAFGGAQNVVTLGSGSHVLALSMAEDAWNGDAQFTVAVDGTQVGGVQTVTASHAAGQSEMFNLLGDYAAGPHTLSVTFLNDAYGGPGMDRNLYVDGASLDGASVTGSAVPLFWNTTAPIGFDVPGSATAATPDTLDLKVSEDAWQGDAQFTIAINGTTLAGTYAATASHGSGASTDVVVKGNWGAAPTIGISFINDAYGGPGMDRNLFVDGATYDGESLTGAPQPLFWNETANLAVPGNASTIALNLSQDAWQGDALASVAVDGVTLASSVDVAALHGQGQSQLLDVTSALAPGQHDLAVSFLNDAYGGSASTDRNLYLDGVQVNGTTLAGATAALYSSGTDHFTFVVPA